MKRSKINFLLHEAEAFIASNGFKLPAFAAWDPERISSDEAHRIRSRKLGWDITDYGLQRFESLGLLLFTIRNGTLEEQEKGGAAYAEKLLISRNEQISPMHRHNVKTEDIINRGGAELVLELYASSGDGSIDRHSELSVFVDSIEHGLKAGEKLRLEPGQSVTLTPNIWHAFWAEGGDCLIGEVSTINDDETDNIFELPLARFSTIEEDEPPYRLLVSDYDALDEAEAVS